MSWKAPVSTHSLRSSVQKSRVWPCRLNSYGIPPKPLSPPAPPPRFFDADGAARGGGAGDAFAHHLVVVVAQRDDRVVAEVGEGRRRVGYLPAALRLRDQLVDREAEGERHLRREVRLGEAQQPLGVLPGRVEPVVADGAVVVGDGVAE